MHHTWTTGLCNVMQSDPQQLLQWVTRATQIYNARQVWGNGGASAAKGAPLAREQAEAGLEIGPKCTLSIVRQYLHVGTLCADTSTHMPNIKKRCKSATHAHMELAGIFYARSAIPRVDRIRGAGSMVFSRLLGNGPAWDPLLHGALQALNTVQCEVWRCIARNWRGTPAALSDDALREAMQVDSVLKLLRKS